MRHAQQETTHVPARRRLLLVLSGVAVVGVASATIVALGAADVGADVGADDRPPPAVAKATSAPPPAGNHDHVSRDYSALWDAATPEERAGATRLVDETRVGIERYRDVEVALADGYAPRLDRPRATHFPSATARADGAVLDPTRPESLVYRTLPDGRKVLLGALFRVGAGEEAPAPGGPLSAWHSHPSRGKRCYPATDPGCSGGAQMLHVYVFGGVVDPFAESPAAAAGRV